jgi:effector-binding domain-containing protein
MDDSVQLKQVESQFTAVIRRRVGGVSELPTVVPSLCGEVWTYVRAAGLPHPGRHLAVYLDSDWNIEVGVEVTEPFAGEGDVVCSHTPAGLVATTFLLGPYSRLNEPHETIHRWCKQNGHTPVRPCWEVYGHWDDDPAKLRTDVFYLLKAPGDPVA